jgi:cysteinyl-tRNA synthetase
VKRLEEAERMLGRWAKIRKTQSERDWQELNSVLSNPIPVDTIITPLSDDLNTHAVIQALQSMARAAEGGTDYVALRLLGTIAFLGIDLAGATAGLSAPEIEDTLINDAIRERLAFIAAKNWAEADRIRDELLAKGIQLKDGKDPETGERVTTWEIKR